MAFLGTHLMLDLRRCNPTLLDDLEFVRRTLIDAAVEAGATIVGQSFHKSRTVGITGVIALAESHVCVHTWPKHAAAAVDILTCGAHLRPGRAAELIIQGLECREPSVTELQRGRVHELSAAVPR